ncbi:MAG: ABC transporter substrate-binding protein [Acidobacteria bacterium]|nr:ABC transporter substrate-binding protein [Acidobacteriota bacterium]
MRRRDFLAVLGGSAVLCPCSLRAQQTVREVGFLHQGSPEPASLLQAFGKGLEDAGISVEADVRIEHQWAEGEYNRLPALAKDLVDRKVGLIAANYLPAALAAKAATRTIPIVFLSGSDPVASGLVSSFNRPGGNVTGIAFMFTRLGPKNLELIHELRPNANVVAVLMNPTNPNAASQVDDLQAAAHSLGLELAVLGASTEKEVNEGFGRVAERDIGALVVTADGFLISRQDQLVALAARYSVPTIYPLSQYVIAGGLMSYGASLSDAFRQTGRYVGRVLKGAAPGDLPVLQAANFELVVNLKTAKELGLSFPQSLLLRANEIVE